MLFALFVLIFGWLFLHWFVKTSVSIWLNFRSRRIMKDMPTRGHWLMGTSKEISANIFRLQDHRSLSLHLIQHFPKSTQNFPKSHTTHTTIGYCALQAEWKAWRGDQFSISSHLFFVLTHL